MIIGPYFFEDKRGVDVTVNSECYLAMLKNFYIPELPCKTLYIRAQPFACGAYLVHG